MHVVVDCLLHVRIGVFTDWVADWQSKLSPSCINQIHSYVSLGSVDGIECLLRNSKHKQIWSDGCTKNALAYVFHA